MHRMSQGLQSLLLSFTGPQQKPGMGSTFWNKVGPTTEKGCNLWLSTKEPSGRALSYQNNECVKAKDVAWLLSRGSIPEGHVVLQSCGDRSCVNPEHLYTKAPNVLSEPSPVRSTPLSPFVPLEYGGGDGRVKLTHQEVRDIRAAWDSGDSTQSAMARRYGVSLMTIHHIVHRVSRRDVV